LWEIELLGVAQKECKFGKIEPTLALSLKQYERPLSHRQSQFPVMNRSGYAQRASASLASA
jgi:hypothetical protein